MFSTVRKRAGNQYRDIRRYNVNVTNYRRYVPYAHVQCLLRSLPIPGHGRGFALDSGGPKEGMTGRVASAAMVGIIQFYKRYITDNMPPNCRFQPTCSTYMLEAITRYGAVRGFILSAWRIVRCNPTGGAGYDPVRWPPVSYRAGSWTE